MNIFKKIAIIAPLATICGISYASNPVMVSIDGAPAVQLSSNPITDTFTGEATLSAGLCQIDCDFSATGTVTDNGTNMLGLEITDLESSGGLFGICSLVEFDYLPLISTAPHSSIVAGPPMTVPFTVGLVRVESPCGNCEGYVNAQYSNANDGSFSFTGTLSTLPPTSCSVSTTVALTSENNHTYEMSH